MTAVGDFTQQELEAALADLRSHMLELLEGINDLDRLTRVSLASDVAELFQVMDGFLTEVQTVLEYPELLVILPVTATAH